IVDRCTDTIEHAEQNDRVGAATGLGHHPLTEHRAQTAHGLIARGAQHRRVAKEDEPARDRRESVSECWLDRGTAKPAVVSGFRSRLCAPEHRQDRLQTPPHGCRSQGRHTLLCYAFHVLSLIAGAYFYFNG